MSMVCLAKEYEDRCEAFDRTVCSGEERNGLAMPGNPKESALICKHARKVMDEICHREGISRADLQSALRSYRR